MPNLFYFFYSNRITEIPSGKKKKSGLEVDKTYLESEADGNTLKPL